MNQHKTIIPSTDIYTLKLDDKNILMFSITMKDGKYNVTLRDIYVDLEKNNIYTLKSLAKYCSIKNYSILKKKDLLYLLSNNIYFDI